MHTLKELELIERDVSAIEGSYGAGEAASFKEPALSRALPESGVNENSSVVRDGASPRLYTSFSAARVWSGSGGQGL